MEREILLHSKTELFHGDTEKEGDNAGMIKIAA